jgi:excinuclease ABC subunit A
MAKNGKKINANLFDETNTLTPNGNGADEELSKIIVRGAREHNLKKIDVDIPREKLVVITGISGSGKSSLAFDTLYAEGQRRYVECLSAYARQYLGMMKKPDVDSIEGLSPAISIEQKSISHNPRSTVGTVTEIYDYLRLLYAKIGIQFCTDCEVPVQKKSSDQIVEEIIKSYEGMKIQILAPLVRGRKGHYKDLFEKLQKQGYTKVRVDNEIREIKDGMQLSRYQIHNIELVVDRCLAEKKQEHRIYESVELALKTGEDTMMILFETGHNEWTEKLFSTQYTCPSCGKAYQELAPNMFSFNSPYGACPQCDGLGDIRDFDRHLVIPNSNLTISEGGIAPLGKDRENWLWSQIHSFCQERDIDIEKPISEIPYEKINLLLFGSEDENIKVKYKAKGSRTTYYHEFIGLLPSLKHHYENTASPAIKRSYENFMSSHACPVCKGGRLKQENLNVFIHNYSINDIVKSDINQALEIFTKIPALMNERETTISKVITNEISSRLKFLQEVGLAYLTIDRAVRSLSGGESQRIRLASQIGSELVGIMYVLDEPSIGLHQHDNNKLIQSLKRLRDLGNSVIVVEHDKAMIEQADYVIDIGPGAGIHGGEIILSKTPKEILKLKNGELEKSLTAKYLKNLKTIPYPEIRRQGNGSKIKLFGAKGNNLKNLDIEFPLGVNICVSGMSGSGKSTLINDTLYPILSRHFYNSVKLPLEYEKIEGLDLIDKVIEIDQSPIGRTPRSNPATYTGLFTLIRDFFTLMPEAKIRGYKAGRFSFNVPGGRCEDCEGGGIKKIEMNFLPDVYIKCDTCNGKRYNRETCEVKYKDKSIADVLDMTVEEALEFFSEIPKIKRKLKTLHEVGLGYITLGQQAPTLSGGEAQRVKLATELSKISTGKTLYLLDEPTTGLHFEDIRILMKLLNKLVDKGNTVIIIEHNLDVIKCADWIIDLGPEGGSKGGMLVAQGTPEDIAKNKKSFTGFYLKEELNKK